MAMWSKLLDVFRGVLIGAAEVVPGVSGGTIALLVGVGVTYGRFLADYVSK